MARTITTLLNAAAVTGPDTIFPGGEAHLIVQATTWNAATAKLQTLSPDGVTYIDVPDASFTANGQVAVKLSQGAYRMNIAGTPTAVSAWLKFIHQGG